VVDRVRAPYRVLLYQPGIRFSLETNSKVLSLQHRAPCNKLLIFFLKKKTLTKLYQIPEGKLRSEIRGTESDFECRETQPFVPIDTGLNVSLLTVRMEQRSKVIISILV